MSGEILRERRESLGLGIRQIADALKINDDYITAIENDDFGRLPVPVYTMGYIRCYAGHLGVDADPIVQHYRKHLSQPQPAAVMPVAFSRKRRPAAMYILLLLAAGLFAFLGVTRILPDNPDTGARVPAPTVRTDMPSAKADAVSLPETQSPGPVASPEAASPTPEGHSLQLAAREKTWIYVTFVDEGRTEEVMLQQGAARNWKFSGKALLKIGNAGGLDVSFDGRELGELGKQGEVRTISLDGSAEN